MSSGKVLIKEIPEMLDDALPGAAVSERAADRAAPALRVIIAAGKFHGVIAAQTPTGSRVARMRRSAALGGMISP